MYMVNNCVFSLANSSPQFLIQLMIMLIPGANVVNLFLLTRIYIIAMKHFRNRRFSPKFINLICQTIEFCKVHKMYILDNLEPCSEIHNALLSQLSLQRVREYNTCSKTTGASFTKLTCVSDLILGIFSCEIHTILCSNVIVTTLEYQA
jgi:hypothetical protein